MFTSHLDVTTHAGILANALNVLYVDTVGFIGKNELG